MILLVNEAVNAFVRDKEQYVIHRAPGGVDVGTTIHGFYVATDVGKKFLLLDGARGVIFGREELFVMGDREFHVHVQAFAFGEVEGEVRSVGAFSGLFVVIFPLQHAEQIEDVLNHALAPLAASLAAGKNLT